MSFTLTLDLVNKSGDLLDRSGQTAGPFTTQPPASLAADGGTGQAVAAGGHDFFVEVWYGHGEAEPQGASIAVSGQEVSCTGTSYARFEIDSRQEDAATVTVTFLPVE